MNHNLSLKIGGIFLFILIIYLLIIIISLWKILIKEGKKPWLSVIPFVNFYQLFKICRIPYWTLFAPVVNIIVFILLPYKLAKQYSCNRKKAILLTFIPFYTFPYIAFSKLQNKDKDNSLTYMKTIDDINRLEIRLNNDQDTIIDDYIETGKKPQKSESNLNDFVEKIENSIINDEYVYTDPIIDENKNDKPKQIEEFVDINADDIVTIKDIDNLEQTIIDNSNQNKQVYESTEEFKTVGPSNEAIAFGGKNVIENNTHSKVEELKCQRCGSSLVGANGFCPGCGTKI